MIYPFKNIYLTQRRKDAKTQDILIICIYRRVSAFICG